MHGLAPGARTIAAGDDSSRLLLASTEDIGQEAAPPARVMRGMDPALAAISRDARPEWKMLKGGRMASGPLRSLGCSALVTAASNPASKNGLPCRPLSYPMQNAHQSPGPPRPSLRRMAAFSRGRPALPCADRTPCLPNWAEGAGERRDARHR